jgi:hypothetical protein
MAGSNPAFNAANFRTQIRAAMTMGESNDIPMQTTWVFGEQTEYLIQDPGDNPYDWGATPTADVLQTTIVVPSAVTFVAGTVEGTPVGEFDASHATLLLLDEDYALVAEATSVIISGNVYDIDPPGWIEQGLFDVSVFQVHVSARS